MSVLNGQHEHNQFPDSFDAMIVGLCTVELEICDANSLKDKRQVLQSLLTRLRNRFNISIAQLDTHDLWNSAALGIACVSNEAVQTGRVLKKVLDAIEREPRVVVLGCQREML